MAKEDQALAARPTGRSLLDAIREGDTRTARDASIEELMALSQASTADLAGAAEVASIQQTGEGYVVVPRQQKRLFVGVPFFIVNVDVNESKKVKGTYFGSMHVRTVRPLDAVRPGCDAFIINDGGTGIFKQLQDMRAAMGLTKMLPLWCSKGLRVSTYEVTQDDPSGEIDPVTEKPKQVPVLDPTTNQPIQGETFYLDDTP